MGMGYMGYLPTWADCIGWEEIEKLCPQEASDFLATLGRYGVTLEAFAQAFTDEETEIVTTFLTDSVDVPEGEATWSPPNGMPLASSGSRATCWMKPPYSPERR
jgi:hypothetical protein